MFRFSGFKASLNFSTGKRSSDYVDNISSFSSTNGAYRANREEFFGTGSTGSFADPSKKITPSMVKLPPSSQTNAVIPSKSTDGLTQSEVSKLPLLPPANNIAKTTKNTSYVTQTQDVKASTIQTDSTSQVLNNQPTVRNAKSTSALDQVSNTPSQLRKSTPNVSSDPRGDPSNYRDSADLRKVNSKDAKKKDKERKMVEKKRLAEQKKNEKLAAQEQAKQEKLRKEKEKQEAKLAKQKAIKDKDKKKNAPVPKQRTNPLAQSSGPLPSATPAQPQALIKTQGPSQYTTNTLESSISRTSGPPAYTDTPAPKAAIVQNENDASGNTSFTKKADNSDYSWDLIAQHRQQISRPPVTGASKPKQKVMDMQYHTGRSSGDDTEVNINPPPASDYF